MLCLQGPGGKIINMAGAQGGSYSPPEDVGALFAPPVEFQSSPGIDSHASQPPVSLTSDLGRFQSPSHSGSPDRLLASLMFAQNAAADGSSSSLNQAGSDHPWTPFQPEQSSSYDIFRAPVAGNGLRQTVTAADGSVVKEVDIFAPFSQKTNLLDPFRAPSSSQEVQDLSVSKVADPFHFSPTKESDIFQIEPKEGAKLFQTALPKENGLSEVADIFSPTSVGDSLDSLDPGGPNRPPDLPLATPLGAKRGIFQPTPFSLALASATTPEQAPTDVPPVSVHHRYTHVSGFFDKYLTSIIGLLMDRISTLVFSCSVMQLYSKCCF